jgi:hypothetical protein
LFPLFQELSAKFLPQPLLKGRYVSRFIEIQAKEIGPTLSPKPGEEVSQNLGVLRM